MIKRKKVNFKGRQIANMTTNKNLVIKLNFQDNLVVALTDILADTYIENENLLIKTYIPAGHKIATTDINIEEPVKKYGQIIGFATQIIKSGEHIHIHNCAVKDFERDYGFCSNSKSTDYVELTKKATFEGIIRSNGQVGTRNYIGVLASVNCSTTVSRYISDAFQSDILVNFPNVDGVVALVHGNGCGMSDQSGTYFNLQRTLCGYIRHPNFAGVLVVGLGCEVNQIDSLLKACNVNPCSNLQILTIQELGGTAATIRQGIACIRDMLPKANQVKRQTVTVEHLTVALQCGGSDGYSGITANPALGVAADLIVQNGGTVILSETPETYGAEHLLTQRAVNDEVAQKLVERIFWWEDYTARNNGEMNNNPSPGNKAGGLTTIIEKSLGAIAKGGTTNLVDVYRYAQPIVTKGLVFMDSPGYDPCSVTGQVASGANIICFTTGRGSVFGCKPVPSLKIASNTPMYQRMKEDMDVNCGLIVDGDATILEMGKYIFQCILDIASGKKSKSEELGFGDCEFVPWQVGAVM